MYMHFFSVIADQKMGQILLDTCTFALLCNVFRMRRLCLTRKLDSCRAQAYRTHARTYLGRQPRRRGIRGSRMRFVFTNPRDCPSAFGTPRICMQ
jgi:hypothetical protein